MNNIIKKSIYVSFLSLAVVLSSCDERLEEVTTLVTDRLFSATDVEASVVNKTQVILKWDKNQNAQSYTIEVFENDSLTFAGTPVMVINDITNADIPYTIATGLVGQTQYSARIKTIGEGIADSKWKGIYFRTAAEQIMQPVNAETVTASTAVIKWTPGETATRVVAINGTNQVSQNVTAAEIAAGSMVLAGLAEDTKYTVRLLKDDKVRGSGSFETMMDLNAAGTVVVNTGDDLLAAIQGAASGTRIVINASAAGDEFLLGGQTIDIDKAISIRGYRQSKMPVVHAMFRATSANTAL